MSLWKTISRGHCAPVLAVVLALGAHAANPPEPFSRTPYLQFASPTLMHVVWRTQGPIEPVVRFG